MKLGAYPTDSYFDSNRPQWLPHWIDTPTESALKWGLYPDVPNVNPLPNPPAAAAPSAPQTIPQMTIPGQWTPELAAQGAAEKSKAQIQAFFSQLADQIAKDQAQNQRDWIWVAVFLGAIALFLLMRGRR